MITIDHLTKRFGRQLVLNDLNLKLESNQIIGLLGRNGVGKSTLLSLISAQIRPTHGSIRVDGKDPWIAPSARAQINFIQEGGYGTNMPVCDILDAASALLPQWDEELKRQLLDLFQVPIKKHFPQLSRGYQTMVGLIIGLAGRSPYTFFDEPSLGLDAANRDDFYRVLLEDFEAHPRTIIISTHLIDEAANLFEKVIMLKDTQLIVDQDVASLLEEHLSLSGRPEAIDEAMKGLPLLQPMAREAFGSHHIVYCRGRLEEDQRERLRQLAITVDPISLQKLFVLLTGETPPSNVPQAQH